MKPTAKIPATIWGLGFVSLFMDISSEMVHGLLPLFLVGELGASAVGLGLLEGFAEGLALVARFFSGALSDWLGRRKLIILAGYLTGALTKPFFALASSIGPAFTARSIDRLGKGLRGAPRDALVADLCPPEQRGAAYGLRQSLDSLGAFLGPLLAVLLMLASGNDFRLVFWLATLPGLMAVCIIILWVRDPATPSPRPARLPLHRREVASLPAPYWLVLALGVVFTMARFSEAFVLLRAGGLGLNPGQVPFILMLLSLVYGLAAYPAGALSDRFGRLIPLYSGLAALLAADLVLAWADSVLAVGLGAGLWGLHLAFTQGLFAALVADTCPAGLRGTGFGLFGLVSGITVLAASVLAGWLWQAFNPAATFLAGALFAGLCLTGLVILHRTGRIRLGG